MNDTQDLKELVQKAAAGDKAAFEELYQATCRLVYFTCLGLLKDEQEAQDITQDVYLTAFEHLGSLKDAGKFKSWIYRIAANKSIKHLRKKQPILPGDEQLENPETEENENFLPEEYVLNADKRKLVLEITRKVCTDVQYQTILLYYFNELSIAEIAEIMECQERVVAVLQVAAALNSIPLANGSIWVTGSLLLALTVNHLVGCTLDGTTIRFLRGLELFCRKDIQIKRCKE